VSLRYPRQGDTSGSR